MVEWEKNYFTETTTVLQVDKDKNKVLNQNNAIYPTFDFRDEKIDSCVPISDVKSFNTMLILK